MLYHEIKIIIGFIIHNRDSLTFTEFLKVVLVNVIVILMLSAKFAVPGLFKTTLFWKTNYDAITFVLNWTELNNFILRWYCTITEANKNQPLITINMVNIYHVEADTEVISMRQPYTAMSIPYWYQNRFMHPQGE